MIVLYIILTNNSFDKHQIQLIYSINNFINFDTFPTMFIIECFIKLPNFIKQKEKNLRLKLIIK